MKIIFVRHGHPNYELDCLTEIGHQHAAAAAERLKNCGIQEIYSSNSGRAIETAEYTAKHYGLDVVQLPFMREIKWGRGDALYTADTHPWNAVDKMVADGENLLQANWREEEPFCGNLLCDVTKMIDTCFDEWLAGHGYVREGHFYRASENTEKTIALFSHGGSSSAVLSHLFNLPFPFVIGSIRPNFTAITVVNFPDKPGELVAPEFELVNDARHIEKIEAERVFGH